MSAFEQQPSATFDEMDIVKQIYKDTPEHLWIAAAYNVNHHLQKLFVEKKITQDGTRWKLKPQSSL